MSASPKRAETSGLDAIPVVAFFSEDAIAAAYLKTTQRYHRLTFDQAAALNGSTEKVVLVSSERFMDQYSAQLRTPNTRVLALSNQPFHDPRNDGAVYAYLPPDVSEPLLARMVDNALDHIHLVQTRYSVNQRLAGIGQEIHELNQIGVALSSEHDPQRLLEMILSKARELTRSDAGSIYLVESAPSGRQQESLLFSADHTGAPIQDEQLEERLRFKLTQNDTVDIPFREVTIEINENSIAGYVALTGAIVNIEDAYHLPAGVPFTINRAFDQDSGYRTRSILAVPMRNQKGKTVGVLQLINAKRDFAVTLDSEDTIAAQVIAYTAQQQEIVTSLASQAAVAFENSQLYDAIQKLFEGFVRASVTAIEARDPATSGHSFRVANLTVALAKAVDRNDSGPYARVRFSRDQMREVRYASLLHDFGKVGVREEVLIKAKKLYPGQMELIQQRFQLIRSALEKESLQEKIQYLVTHGAEGFATAERDSQRKLADRLHRLNEDLQAIIDSNEPTVMPEGNFERLLELAQLQFEASDGTSIPVLKPEEARLLSIRQGSLDDEERLQIEAHVLHTVNFLQQIPWTSELRNVTEIARGHHEKLNGKGYPYKLSAPEIPVQTRMMTIADIFDALAAADRPYKKAVSVDRALEILDLAVEDGEIDPALFEIFKSAKIYQHWRVESAAY